MKLFKKKYDDLTLPEYYEMEFYLMCGERESHIIDAIIYSEMLVDEHHGIYVTV